MSRSTRIINALSTAFPLLGRAIASVMATIKAGEGGVTAFKVALSGLLDIIKAHPILAAITAITSAVVIITNIQNKAREASEEQARKSKEAADNATEESKSLEELIKQYKELASSGKRDTETISQIRDIQNQITKLTKSQKDKLDLVNGSLDKELNKLKQIGKEQAKNKLSTYEKNVDDTVGALNLGDANVFSRAWGQKYIDVDWKLIDTGDDNKKIKEIISKIDGVDLSGNANFIDLDSSIDSYLQISEIMGNIIDALSKEFDTGEGSSVHNLWSSLVESKKQIDKSITDAQSSYQSLANDLVAIGDYDGIDVGSLDDFTKLRDKIIQDLTNNERIKAGLEKGFIDNDWINEQVNAYLAGLTNLSDYYNEWYERNASETSEQIENIKNKFKEAKPNESDDFNTWLNSLSNEDRKIVVEIDTNYSSTNVKNQLETLGEGGTVDLTLRPQIDNSELSKAGWDVEDNGTATVFTSTYSSEDGTRALNFTPIITDENGNYKGVLSPEKLQKYAEGVIDGTRQDDLKLQIGAEFKGENAVQEAERAAKRIHELQDWFYIKGNPAEWTFDQWKQAVEDWEIPEADKISFSDLMSDDSDDSFKKKVETYRDDLSTLSDALEKIKNGNYSNSDIVDLYDKFPQLANQSGNLEEAVTGLINSFKTDAVTVFNEQLDSMETDDDVNALNTLKNAVIGIADGSLKLSGAAGKISEITTSLNDLKTTYEDIKGVIDSYNENGYLTIENVEKILSLEPEYVNLLIDENGQINLNNQAYKDYIATKAKSLLVEQLRSLYDTIIGMSLEEAQAYANAEAFKVETKSVQDLLLATTQLYLVQARVKDNENNTTAWTDALKRGFSTAANYAAMVDSYINSLSTSTNEFSNQTNGTTSALESQKEALEKQKDALEDEKDALEDAKNALEKYKDALEGAQDDIQSLIDLVIDYIKQIKEDEKTALEEQIERYEKQKEVLDEQKEKYSEVIDKKKEALRLAKEEKEAADELLDKQKSVAKNRLALEVAGLDDSSAGRKAKKQAQDSLNDSQKDLSDYLYDQQYNARIAALDKEQEKFEENIEKQKETIDKHIEHVQKQIDKIDKYLNNTRQLYIDACNMIDKKGKKLYKELWKYVYKYTTMTKAEFNNLWSNAQRAIKKYKKDNESLVSVMEKIQKKIYSTDKKIASLGTQIGKVEKKISQLDTAISNTSDAIKSTSDSINSVSSSVSGLGRSISNYIKQLDRLEKREKNRYKWYFKYKGRIFRSKKTSKEDAIQDIYSQIIKAYPREVFDGSGVRRGIKAYAKGTRSSVPGISITQEQGLEAIFGKLQNGQYTMMSQGSQVFNADQTDNLYGFSSDPQKFIKGILDQISYSNFFAAQQSGLNSTIRSMSTSQTQNKGNTTITAPISISIQGDATQSTVNALKKEAKNIQEDTMKAILHYANFNRKNRW